jgi:hypothetical protein
MSPATFKKAFGTAPNPRQALRLSPQSARKRDILTHPAKDVLMRTLHVVSCAALATALSLGCSSSDSTPANSAGTGGSPGTGGTGGTSAAGGTAGTGGTSVTGGAAGTGGTSVTGGAAGSTGGSAGTGGAAGTGGLAGSGGSVGGTGGASPDAGPPSDGSAPDTSVPTEGGTIAPWGGQTGTLLTCTSSVWGAFHWNGPTAVGNGVECDWPQTSIDFEDPAALYKTIGPTPMRVTDWGKAFTKYEINGCHPYCFDRALAVGIDIVGDGTAEASQGEILIDYPAPISPQPTAGMMLAWFFVEGAAGAGLKVQLEARNQAGAVSVYPAAGQTINPGGWLEFKTAPINQAFAAATLTNLVGIGVKVWASPPLAAGNEWHGKIYVDHVEVGDRLTGSAGP